MKLTQEMVLPLFSGFYESIFCNYDSWRESEHYYLTEEENMTDEQASDKLDSCDTRPATLAVSQEVAGGFERLFNDNFETQIKIKYKSLYSPREYNFSTDKIVVNVEFNIISIARLIFINSDDFEKFISKHFSDRSGFISHYSSDIKDCTLSQIEEFDSVQMWAIFAFLCSLGGLDQWSLYEECSDQMSEVFHNNVCYNDES